MSWKSFFTPPAWVPWIIWEGLKHTSFAGASETVSPTLWVVLRGFDVLNREGNGNPLQYSCLEKSHGQRSLVGCSAWGRYESDRTELLHFHFSLSCVGEGNGNPLQCSCLENPRDGGAWWAVVYGVPQSRTQLNRLSSSSSRDKTRKFLTFIVSCARNC